MTPVLAAPLAAVTLLFLAPVADASPTASAPSTVQSESGPLSVYGGDVTVPASEVRNGDVVVYGGAVDIEGTVTHDVTVFGGDATIDGRVGHDVVMLGGAVHLGPHADVGHDVAVIGGDLERDPGSRVGHRIVQGSSSDTFSHLWPSFSAPFVHPTFGPLAGWHPFDLGFGLGLAAGVILLALLLHLFFPNQVATARSALELRPLAALGFGCLTAVAGVLLALLLGITIVLLPVSLAIAVGMAVAWLLGWTAIIVLIGQRLTAALNWRLDAIGSLLLGGLLVALLVNVPLLGGLFGLVAGAMAVGAAVLTRFGTQPAMPGQPPAFWSPAPGPGAGPPPPPEGGAHPSHRPRPRPGERRHHDASDHRRPRPAPARPRRGGRRSLRRPPRARRRHPGRRPRPHRVAAGGRVRPGGAERDGHAGHHPGRVRGAEGAGRRQPPVPPPVAGRGRPAGAGAAVRHHRVVDDADPLPARGHAAALGPAGR